MTTGRAKWAASWVAGLLVASLTLATVGLPALLLLAGAWSFAALANRWVDALAGPASWVAGIIVEATLLVAESAALAVVAPHAHPQWVYVVALVAPLGVALLAYWRLSSAARPRVTRSSARVSGEPWLAVLSVLAIEAMFEAIKLHGHDFGLTWFMASDARNQVVGTREVLTAGGITLKQMSTYPALTNALSAIVDGAGGRADLNAAVLMVRDVQAMIATVILSCIAIALAFIAAVSETFARSPDNARRLPPILVIPLAACGSLAIGAFILGLSASGGFLSAIGALAFAVAALVLGLRIVHRYDNVTLFLLTCSLVLVMGSWTFLVVVPALAMVAGIVGGARGVWRRPGPLTRDAMITWGTVLVATLALCAVAGVLILKQGTLIATLKASGGIVVANPRLFYWLAPVVVISVFTVKETSQRLVRLFVLAEFVVLALVTLWIRRLHPFGLDWSYYATKMLWLATATLLWTPFVLLVDLLRMISRWVQAMGPRTAAQVAVSLAGSSTILWGVGHETPFPFPWQWAYVGSTYPSPRVIEEVLHQAALGAPFVLWEYSSVPIDNQLGNFWSALTWDYRSNETPYTMKDGSSFMSWAYDENGTLGALCTAVTDFKTRVITSNPHVIPTLRATCPAYRRYFPANTSNSPARG